MKNLAKALVLCQSELKDVFKGQKGYGYNYAPLDEVLKQIRPIATKYGLSFIQSQEYKDGVVSVKTIILHESGESVETFSQSPFAQLKGMNDYQSIGSAITYLRRYAISAAFGIASDEDQDAHGEQVKEKLTPPAKTDKAGMNKAKQELIKQASQITGIDFAKDKEALIFMLENLGIPTDAKTDKELSEQYAVIRKWLFDVELLEQQLAIFLKQYEQFQETK